MLVPLVILALLSLCGGWIGIQRFAAFLAPSVGAPSTAPAGNDSLEFLLSVLAVAVALIGWFIAYQLYLRKPERPAQLAAAHPGAYKLLANKYYGDEIYGAIVVKPLFAFSKYALGGVELLLSGVAWLLAGTAMFAGMILQRWQSGNLRSYAAWLAAGAVAVLLFVLLSSAWLTTGIGIFSKAMGH
jgi:NADH-quinone oxidoreductase subunit L